MKKDQEEISYWQSTADILAALLLVIILVATVFVLYLMGSPKEEWERAFVTATPEVSPTVTPSATPVPTPAPSDYYDHGGDYPGWSPTPTVTPTVTPTYRANGAGYGKTDDGHDKVAVYVLLTDSETGRVIPEDGIQFTLHDSDGVRQLLYTYYPQQISYTEFETTEEGVFFLPEKIVEGDYLLRGINAPRGYYIPGETAFTAEEDHDWTNPLIVKVTAIPVKSAIMVSLRDSDTLSTLSGAVFEVRAAENIMTSEGTIRAMKGELIDTITISDEAEYTDSSELYPGIYSISVTDIPEFYTGGQVKNNVVVAANEYGPIPARVDFTSQKTKIFFSVKDELYTTRAITGAAFSVVSSADPSDVKELVTDANGLFMLTDLEKDTTYAFTQTGSAGRYFFSTEPVYVYVDQNGLIDNRSTSELTVTNRLTRVSVTVRNTILRQVQSGISVGMYTAGGETVRIWTSNAIPESIEGIEPGDYYIILNGDKSAAQHITVADSAEIQAFAYNLWTLYDILVIAGGALAFAAIVTIAVILGKKKKH